jgi:hypothetical protein
LPEKLLRAGDREGELLYRWFRREISAAFARGLPDDEEQADQMAAKAWCAAQAEKARGAKPECPLDSKPLPSRVPVRSRIGLVDLQRRIGLVFWLQRPRFWTRQREEKTLGLEEVLAPSRARLEGRWRRLRYRSRKPSPWEGSILQREAWGRRRAVAAGKPNEAPLAPSPAASGLRPSIAQSVASGEKLPEASPPALRQHPRWARQDPRKRLLVALRELARDCDLDGVGLAAALLGKFAENTGQGLSDGVKTGGSAPSALREGSSLSGRLS